LQQYQPFGNLAQQAQGQVSPVKNFFTENNVNGIPALGQYLSGGANQKEQDFFSKYLQGKA
jgi:hypothetical protein